MDPGEGPGDPFADVPLFREIQRVLRAGSGPINWELARQVAIAGSTVSEPDPEPDERECAELEGAVRMAELAIGEATGLTAGTLQVRTVRRAGWIESNVAGLRHLFEPAASRLGELLREARNREASEAGEGAGMETAGMMESLLGQLSPLLMGAQVGTVLGGLGGRVLSQYELPVPRSEPELLFVIPNIRAFEEAWSLDPDPFRAWVALHESAHALTIGRGWVLGHVTKLVSDASQGIQFDLEGLEARLVALDRSDPEALSAALGDPSELLVVDPGEEHRLARDRVHAFVAFAEGHADHVLGLVGPERLPGHARIEEALRRRHEDRGAEERMVDRLLGLEITDQVRARGRSFCETVVERTDEAMLARAWEDPEALPSMPELEEPTLWLARSA